MKILTKILLLLCIFSTLFTSCVMYKPQSVDVPLINHKGDCRLDAAVSVSPVFVISEPVANVTTTYGFTDWGAGQLHVNWNGSNGVYLQGAVGYYVPIEKAVFECYVGYGLGHNKVDYDNETKSVEGIHQQIFVQPNFGWVNLANGHIDLGVGLKCGYIVPNVTSRKLDETTGVFVNNETYSSAYPLFEPQIFVRFGGENLKFCIRAGYCEFFNDEAFVFGSTSAILAPFTLSAGINYRF